MQETDTIMMQSYIIYLKYNRQNVLNIIYAVSKIL